MRSEQHRLPIMRKLITLCSLLAAALCATKAQIAPNARYSEYVETFAPMAIAEMNLSRIPASITLAQGLLESGAGTSSLARESNNHFGIKCGSSWTGRTHHHEDDDYDRGRLIHSCFRAYADPAESYRDHSEFLMGSSRYAGLFQLDPTDYSAWAHGLKDAGYATSPTYAKKLIEIIELYDLPRYDQGLVGLPLADQTLTDGAHRRDQSSYGKPTLSGAKFPNQRTSGSSRSSSSRNNSSSRSSTSRSNTVAATTQDDVYEINDVPYLVASGGETVNDMARRGRVGANDLLRYNEELDRIADRPATGQRVYLKPKRKNYRGRDKEHRIGATETTQSIADLYGLNTASLKRRNRIPSDKEPVTGEAIVLRGNRSSKDEPRLMSARKRRSEIAETVAAMPAPTAPAVAEVGAETTTTSVATASEAPAAAKPQPRSRKEVPTIIILPPAELAADASASIGTDPAAAATPTPVESRATPSATAQQERPSTVAQPAKSHPRYVDVKQGDTLFAISRATGVSVAEIRALNGLHDNNIRVGQRLLISR